MSNTWMLHTNGDPLSTARSFLERLWVKAGLDGLLVPLYRPEPPWVAPDLILDRARLVEADPFAPVMVVNSASLVVRMAAEHPDGRYGAIMRSCEVRALRTIARESGMRIDNWLILGVDCLACYPADDFAWRLMKAGTLQKLTRESLQFSRQGGIAPYRFRSACQMCSQVAAVEADIRFCLIGLPVNKFIMIAAHDADIADRCGLGDLMNEMAGQKSLRDHYDRLADIQARRRRFRERVLRNLDPALPLSVERLMAHLCSCSPCRKCLEACAICSAWRPAIRPGEMSSKKQIEGWLAACVGCGMCEQACPRQIPLAAVMVFLNEYLRRLTGGALKHNLEGAGYAPTPTN